MIRYCSTHGEENRSLDRVILKEAAKMAAAIDRKDFRFFGFDWFDCCKRLSYYFLSKRLSNLIKVGKIADISLLCSS